jgi:hypothetical protein
MKVILFAVISLILSNVSYAQSKYYSYSKQIKEREQALNSFDFSQYNPLVEKQMREDFDNFKAEMERARLEDPQVKAEIAAQRAARDKQRATLERWSKKIPQTIKSKRRVIEVE